MFENIEFFISAIIGIIFFVLYLLVDKASANKEKLKKLEHDARMTTAYNELGLDKDNDPLLELEEDKSNTARACERMLRSFGFDVDEELKIMRMKTVRAGMTSQNAPVFLLFYRKVLSFVIAIIGALFLLEESLAGLTIGLILLIIGLFGAQLYMSNTTQKRQKALLRSFPDGLDLMVVCVESGLALDAAINRVCSELDYAHPELAKELNQTRLELALLNNRSQALMNLAERADLVAYRSLVAALIQTERFGTNLTDTLRVLSDDYRQTRLMLAEEKAGRLPALMAIPLITMLLPALMMLVLGPAIIKLMGLGGIDQSAPQ